VNKLGKMTAVLMTAALASAVVVGVRSIPDLKRYLQMRRM